MDIDFVISWVDGNDPAWQQEKAQYSGKVAEDANTENRFRDWGLLPYWFRSVEKFAPWVRRIYFVTCGQTPLFLQTDHPKLRLVNHKDFIPREYLPTFSSHTIEMNLHRLPGLAEHFVYFNDDMFLLRPLQETVFFKNDLPCTFGGEIPFEIIGNIEAWQHAAVNDLGVINRHFSKKEQVQKFRNKFVNKAYRLQDNLRTLALEQIFPFYFSGFRNIHGPVPYKKETFQKVWAAEPALLNKTCLHKFRENDSVNQWVCLWWQIASGDFSPVWVDNYVENVTESLIDPICNVIRSQSHDSICVNDPIETIDFDRLSTKLHDAFSSILPEKSAFER